MVQPKNEGYLGNTRIKRSGVETQYTKEELDEYLKCSKDPVHFIEEYCQVISLDEGLVPFKLRGYQQELIEHYDTNRFNVVLASRQSGKSITSCAYLLWYLLFNPEVTVHTCKQRCNCKRDDWKDCDYVRICSFLFYWCQNS